MRTRSRGRCRRSRSCPGRDVRALLGFDANGDLAFWRALALDIPLAVAVTAAAVFLSVRSARLGLAGRFATAPVARTSSPARWGKRPLYRREWLWFTRDGSAIVQAVFVPLSLAAIQAFNLRGLFSHALTSWNGLCGAAILFGTYFLLVLGPKSLASEGQALWIALTWPKGLEDLLKTKARLWASIASVIVLLALVAAAWRFPGDVGWIALTGVLWLVFSRSLAEKVVTLATTTTSSGEPQKIPMGLRWASTLGSLSFAIGIMAQQWSLAVAGVVYSTLTAAAMWQNFRFRLPFLFDPWSETAPPPPTLLNAMIAISVMVEAASMIAALATAVLGSDNAVVIIAASYGACALIVCTCVVYFLRSKNVSLAGIVQWGAPAKRGRDGGVDCGRPRWRAWPSAASRISISPRSSGIPPRRRRWQRSRARDGHRPACSRGLFRDGGRVRAVRGGVFVSRLALSRARSRMGRRARGRRRGGVLRGLSPAAVLAAGVRARRA